MIRGFPNRATDIGESLYIPQGRSRSRAVRYLCERQPGEAKHLSTRRRRNHRDSLSSGERKGNSLNRFTSGMRE